MLTKVQWADAFRRGLLADGKYISGLLEDHGGRLNFFLKFGSSCTFWSSKGQWILLWRQQFLIFIMWKNINLFSLPWIVAHNKIWTRYCWGLGRELTCIFANNFSILFILLYFELSPRSRYVHQDSVKLLYPAGLAWAIALPCHGANVLISLLEWLLHMGTFHCICLTPEYCLQTQFHLCLGARCLWGKMKNTAYAQAGFQLFTSSKPGSSGNRQTGSSCVGTVRWKVGFID